MTLSVFCLGVSFLGKPAKTLQAVTHPNYLSKFSLSSLFLIVSHVRIMANNHISAMGKNSIPG